MTTVNTSGGKLGMLMSVYIICDIIRNEIWDTYGGLYIILIESQLLFNYDIESHSSHPAIRTSVRDMRRLRLYSDLLPHISP